MNEKVVILCPFYNDQDSFQHLLSALENTVTQLKEYQVSMLIVNDGSNLPVHFENTSLIPIQVLNLHRNIGHQKALAIGLAYIKDHSMADCVVVMDSDGEDQPGDIIHLLNEMKRLPGTVVFALRGKRQEGGQFQFFYWLYKLSFRILTGKKIAFGNFMVIPVRELHKVVYYSEIWSHLAGGILKSGLPFTSVKTNRGKRFAGKSKMSFNKLLIHGLGAISVFMDVIASRLLVFSFSLIGFSLAVILTLLGIRIFTNLAIPGWTSTVMSSMLVVLLQSFLLSLVTLFLYFSSESQRKFVPAHHYKDYTGEIETISA